jgi:hypothetical protein
MAGFGINTRGTSQLLFRPGLDKNFFTSYLEQPMVAPRIMKFGATDQVEIQRTRITGPSRMYRSYEGEPPVLSRVTVADKFTAVDRTFQLGYGVTIEAREDDLYGVLNKGATYLGHAARMTQEYLVGAFLDDAFAGTAGYLGMDGLPLFSASHTLMSSSTLQSNLVANPVALSVNGLTAMLQLYRDMKDENGDPIMSTPDTLIIPNRVGMEMDAVRILNQAMEFGTANNNDNPFKAVLGSKKINIIVDPYQTTTSAYYMLDSKMNDAHFLIRKGITLRDWMDDPTQTQFYANRMRILSYFYNWRGWTGANPV